MSIKTSFLITLGIILGLPIGTGITTFIYAEGPSYFSSDARACINCHAMNDQFSSWQASSHRPVASCNDCHSNGSAVEMYAQKAVNGALHSWAFTTGEYHQPIRIKKFNREIAHRSCLDCHSNLIETSHFSEHSFGQRDCLRCHRDVGHKR